MSPSCPVISWRIGTNLGVSAGASPTQMKIWTARDGSRWAWKRKRVECACAHVFKVGCCCHRHRLQLQMWRRWSVSNPSIVLGFNISSRFLAAEKVVFETVPAEASPNEPVNAPSPWIGLHAIALALSAALVVQPAYAAVRPAVLPELGVQMEVANESASSVEAIFAKQLAHRFREMSDEELADILQQLLQASRSSPRTQNSVNGSVPEDLVIQKDERRIETKAAERIREEVRGSASKETRTSAGKEVNDSTIFSETQSGNFQGPIETRESIEDKVPLPQAKRMNEKEDERKKKKFYDKNNGMEPQGEDLSVEKANVETRSDAQFSETQETSTRVSSANAPSSAQNDAGDASLKSKSDLSNTTGPKSAAVLSSGKVNDNATGVIEGEDATELLWAEWNRRASGLDLQESQTSSTSFNFPKFGQDVITKVAAFTELQKAVSIFIIWSFLMVVAFYLGRSRASARKYMPKREEAPINYQGNQSFSPVSSDGRARRDLKPLSLTLSRVSDIFLDYGDALKEFMTKSNRVSDVSKREENYEADMLPVEGEPNNKDDQPENVKRWRTPLIQSLLSATQETSTRKNKGSFDLSIPASSGQDLNYLSNPPTNGTRRESTSSVLGGSHAISSELKHPQDPDGGKETSADPMKPLYSSRVSVNSVDSSSSELQAAAYRPPSRNFQSPWQGDWRIPKVNQESEYYASGGDKDPGEWSTNDPEYARAMSKIAVVDWSEGANLDHGRAISPTGDMYSTVTTGTGSNLSSQKNPPKHMPIERQVDDDWGQLSSKRFVRDFDSNEQAGQEDSLEGVIAERHVARETEGSHVSQSRAKLDSFAHDHTLWVRDGDGIFIRKAAGIEEGEANMATSLPIYEQDVQRATPSFDPESNGNHRFPVGATKPRTGFDYRQVVIESTGALPRKDQNGLAMESEPAARKNTVWPLRYRSGRQKVSQ